ncbi:SMP-30/gluconolactonase/LRE family protein [Leptospira gomenensis]|uniref:SMP-30/gluconolactonase/LRE family protein n=1 Tax=Leptospira gomenensis TaxID=2484974 RepID=A0A5F1Y6F4_9LEPT|nr:SMP-30/gluconolactonase/LRE family protein [Leptospira gomenensis]TGK28781.1 SMP-30/gluconolactonase/LRE family protein [Leptospira gomenensis]TGK37632.1 SMP-30/gluconolactonase/LRE family protein [Leptospira gomenensis]TGK51539.1 SMP-30/gluconolactonase/LRE family protein [Leptospira gomenensis]TGK68096.1 SMP-30/gluconolactonase/LRE family protein [Leptospira gomenensis]
MFRKFFLFSVVLICVCSVFFGIVFIRSIGISTETYLTDSPFELGKNNHLLEAEWIHKEVLDRPYGIAIDSGGSIYTGTADRRIVRIRTNEKTETFALLGGRPLGLDFDQAGNLFVCVEEVGIVRIDKNGNVRTVISELPDGTPLRFPHGIDVARDGRIFFTVSSLEHSWDNSFLEELSAKPEGMILIAEPDFSKLEILNQELYYPAGIALSRDGRFLLVSEPFRHRISSVPLTGKKRGIEKFFLTNIPGIPTLISGKSAAFWIGIPYYRNEILDRIQEYPEIKNLLSGLPAFFFVQKNPRGLVVSMNDFGDVMANYQDFTGSSISGITAVLEHAGNIFLVSSTSGKIAKMKPVVEEIRFF